MSLQLQKITDPLVLGEGPHWDARAQALYFVDIEARSIHKYVPSTGTHTKTKLDGRVGFIIPVEGTSDQFLVGLERKFVIVRWDGVENSGATIVKELAEVEQEVPRNRINDAKADPKGRVYGGTIGYMDPPGHFNGHKSALYRIEGETITKIVEGVSVSNGLAWDVEEKAFYYTDSMERKVRRYDYDVKTGEISNFKYIFDLEKQNINGIPDGSTIDTDGNLWIAVYRGSCILKIDPRSGELLQKVPLPATQVTSMTFGGPDHDVLFVTTASKGAASEDVQGGTTFMLTGLGAKGFPNVNYKP